MNNKLKAFAIAIYASAFTQVGSDLYLPSLPAVARSLTTSIDSVQLTITMYIIGLSLAQLIYAPISDGIGRRKPLMTGLLIGFIGSIICTFSYRIDTLVLGRLLQGLGIGIGASLIRPIMRDLFSGKELAKYGSYASLASISVLASAPLLGGYLQHYIGWRANFWFLTVGTLLLLAATILYFPETNTHLHKDNLRLRTVIANVRSIFQSLTFLSYCVVCMAMYAAIVAWLTAGPIVLEERIGLSPVSYGWVYLISGGAFAVGALLNTRLVGRFAINSLILFGLGIVFTAGLLMLTSYLMGYLNTLVIVIPVILLLFGASLIFPNSAAGGMNEFPHIAGIAAAIFGAIQVIGGAISSFLLALSHDQNQLPMAIAFLACASIAALGFISLQALAQRVNDRSSS